MSNIFMHQTHYDTNTYSVLDTPITSSILMDTTKALKLRDFLLLFWLFVFFPTVNSRWVWLKKKGNIVTLQNKLR